MLSERAKALRMNGETALPGRGEFHLDRVFSKWDDVEVVPPDYSKSIAQFSSAVVL